MVQLMNSSNLRSESESDSSSQKVSFVKTEIEDSLDDEHGPLHKRSKLRSTFQQQWSAGSSSVAPQQQYNPLEEPSPLGLRLRKSPSLLELIQMRLAQGNISSLGGVEQSGSLDIGKKGVKDSGVASTNDKLKASNFPGSLLKIGTWEYVSRYEGDLVAKCYFAKHKLVWEVLEGGLKSKIEIQWSDIAALKAKFPDDGPATLDIVLSRQPSFFRETNPQPRKHTLWQATSDFTGGQASIHRQHFLQCPQGLLSKHFEKLIQCDARLNLLSQQSGIIVDSPYFEPKGSVFDDSTESKDDGYDQRNHEYVSALYGVRDVPSPSASLSSSSKSEFQDVSVDRASEHMSRENPSPSSVMDSRVIEENSSTGFGNLKGMNNWDQQFKVPGLHASMSMSDLVSHLGHCISEQMASGDPSLVDGGLQSKDMLEEITQHLLGGSDSQFASAADEKSLMARVNSLCCLLQKDSSSVQNLQASGVEADDEVHSTSESTLENKAAPGLSRKDSVGDLLLHLPRIASLPHFLFNIAEGSSSDNQAR